MQNVEISDSLLKIVLRIGRRGCGIHCNIKDIIGRNCKTRKLMKFFSIIGGFEDI